MGWRIGWVLVVVLASGGVARASGRHQQWKAVKRLGVGVAVEVRAAGQAGVEECRVVRVDDTALTCEREKNPNADWDAGSGARLVFPRGSVQGVWMWQDDSDRRLLRGLGFGFAIGALVCAEGGPAAAFICAGIGALIGACAATSNAPTGPWWYPPGTPRPARRGEMVRKVIYQAPVGALSTP
jgi:hypothetical protein